MRMNRKERERENGRKKYKYESRREKCVNI
jgi:hypothetical protein